LQYCEFHQKPAKTSKKKCIGKKCKFSRRFGVSIGEAERPCDAEKRGKVGGEGEIGECHPTGFAASVSIATDVHREPLNETKLNKKDFN